MAPTTRSTKGRSSAGSKAPSPQVQAGPSRGASQQGTSQRTAGAASRSSAVVVSSDDDDDDDDEDDDDDDDDDDDEEDEDDNENEEDEDDDENDEKDDDGSEDESGDESDNNDGGQQQGQTNTVNDRRMELVKIFASTEPNGFTTNEITTGKSQNNNVSAKYRELMAVVIGEALANPRLYNNILRVLETPSDEWSGLIYARLRDRLELAIRRPDPNMIGDTANRLKSLIEAIMEVTADNYWDKMEIMTRLLFFGLLLKVIRHIVASDVKASRPGSGSGGSSPYTGDPAMNHNLYHIMVNNYQCFTATNLLHQLFGRLGAHLNVGQMALLRELLDIVKAKYNRRGSPSAGDAKSPSQSFLLALERLCSALPTSTPQSSRGG